jgi:iron complex outermembrane receptor protein
LPSKYTLVLIDGVRPPPAALNNSFGGGFAAAIQAIPLDAVERVEILLDGATAVYGSDAIAGVVNFILKKNSTEGNAYAQYTWPTHGDAQSVNAGVSKGWGDLAKDGWNVMGTFSYNHQSKLQATDRKVSRQGAVLPVHAQRRELHLQQRDREHGAWQSHFPGSAGFESVGCADAVLDQPVLPAEWQLSRIRPSSSPIRPAPGSLGAVGESCRFNYAATVQDVPPSDTLNFLGKGYLKLGDSATAWVTVNLSHFETTPQYAPPAQPFGLNTTTRTPILYNKYSPAVPDGQQPAHRQSRSVRLQRHAGERRLSGQVAGRPCRQVRDEHAAIRAGVDGNAWGLGLQRARLVRRCEVHGYRRRRLHGLHRVSSTRSTPGLYDPIMGTGGASVAPFILDSKFLTSHSKLGNLHLGAQHDFFELSGGPTILALGARLLQAEVQRRLRRLLPLRQRVLDAAGLCLRFPIGGNYGPGSAGHGSGQLGSRSPSGSFPITKSLEATASIRYDHYDKTHSNWVFSTT